jgi:hypothetical protein
MLKGTGTGNFAAMECLRVRYETERMALRREVSPVAG